MTDEEDERYRQALHMALSRLIQALLVLEPTPENLDDMREAVQKVGVPGEGIVITFASPTNCRVPRTTPYTIFYEKPITVETTRPDPMRKGPSSLLPN